MFHKTLVALAGEEVIGDGSIGAEGLGWCEVVDLAGYALGAELASRGLFEAWWERRLQSLARVIDERRFFFFSFFFFNIAGAGSRTILKNMLH